MPQEFDAFRTLIRAEGRRRYRDLPWRRTRDPYRIWVSEVMLQQTQVSRVEARMPAWLERFPNVEALAAAPTSNVLAAWQGMGYNRRALALHDAACQIVERYGGVFPRDAEELRALPGIGPATAQGIRAFAFDLPGVYLETNVRAVFLHHFFPDVPGVPDRELVALIEATCPQAPADVDAVTLEQPSIYAAPQDEADTPRSWYYALLDYGAYLKKAVPNPSRRSAGHVRQSRFEGSRRQKRAEVVRLLLAARDAEPPGLTTNDVTAELTAFEQAAGREPVEPVVTEEILSALAREGFCTECQGRWCIV